MIQLEELEDAVRIAYGETGPSSRGEEAVEFCKRVLESDNTFRVCAPFLFQSREMVMHHFCLKVIEHAISFRYLDLGGDDKRNIHDSLMQYYAFIAENEEVPEWVREKFGQVVVQLFRHEYLEGWGSFFDELRAPCQNGNLSALDMYQRVLIAMHDYVIAPESFRAPADRSLAMGVKDEMRKGAIEHIAADFLSILKMPDDAVVIKKLALTNMQNFIEWMDISLVVNDHILPLLFDGLRHRKLQKGCCRCLSEVVEKGMEPPQKLELLQTLDLTSRLSNVPVDNVKFAVLLSKLICDTGVQALGTLTFLDGNITMQEVEMQISLKAFDICLEFFAHSDNNVSQAAFNLCDTFIQYAKKENGDDEHMINRIGKLLVGCHSKLAYPPDYCFDEPDEDEDAFNLYRMSLTRVFKSIVRLQPRRSMEYILNALDAASRNVQEVSMAELEVALYMTFVVGDCVNKEEYLPALIGMSVERKVIEHESAAVPLMFMDMVVRYAKFIPRDEGLLAEILQMFLGEHALRNQSRRVRSRACYFFFRLIRSLLDCVGAFAQAIIENLKPLLVVETNLNEDVISSDDQCSLFEGLGYLVAVSTDNREALLEHSLGLVLAQARSIIAEASEDPAQVEDPRFAVYVSRIIAVLAHYAQGFEKKEVPEAKPFFDAALELCGITLGLLPDDQQVRANSVFLLHRLVLCLGESILEPMTQFVQHLLKFLPDDSASYMELFQLLTQLMSTFGQKCADLFDQLYSPLLDRSSQYFLRICPIRSEEGMEIDRAQRQFFVFIRSLFSCDLVGVMTSERNVGRINDVIAALLQPLRQFDGTTIGTKSLCYKVLRKMCKAWHDNPMFRAIIVEQAFPVIFLVPLEEEFSLKDASCAGLLLDIASFQAEACAMDEEMPMQLAKFLASKGLGDVAEEYVARLGQSDVREFTKWFKSLIEHMRQGG